MELKGQILEFIYKNDSNSYTIAEFEENNGNSLTIVGYLPFIEEGDTLKIVGKMVTHQEYGEQFKIDTFEKLMPENSKSLERYLASRNYKRYWTSYSKKNNRKIWRRSYSYF